MFELNNTIPLQPALPPDEIPIPGEMGRLYLEMRDSDGMSLACARPREDKPYKQVVEEYVEKRNQSGFNPVAFWEENFETPEFKTDKPVGTEGLNLFDYAVHVRDHIHQNGQNSNISRIEMPHKPLAAGMGRFPHEYHWDAYLQMKGYAATGNWERVLQGVENMESQILSYGHVLNGDAPFYVTRAQPPYFARAVQMLSEKYGPETYVRFLPALDKEYAYWMNGKDYLRNLPKDGKPFAYRNLVRLPDGTFLNRYWDDGNGPRLESYKEDVDLGEVATRGLSGAARQRKLQQIFKDIRLAAASGWDFSSRWLADGKSLETINTSQIAPVDLQSLIADNSKILTIAHRAAAMHNNSDQYKRDKHLEMATYYQAETMEHEDVINRYHWNPEKRTYFDYNWVEGRQTNVMHAAMAYPLYAGLASEDQAHGVADAIESELLYPGGVIATNSTESHQQWDGGKNGQGPMNVWAPPNWIVARGLARTGIKLEMNDRNGDRFKALGLLARNNYLNGNNIAYKTFGFVPEKIRGDRPDVLAGGGEYKVVQDLAMSLGTLAALETWDPNSPYGCVPVIRQAEMHD